jgi:hypothetical protein
MCLYSLIYYTFTLVINNYELYLSLILLYEKLCMLDRVETESQTHRHGSFWSLEREGDGNGGFSFAATEVVERVAGGPLTHTP